ncbi:hypothetical protein [Arthrobacter sp. SDTb3-6]|uniref:hypothetical protein n=1 Tax=Arthrobacter sp. SDTb3-6 TaxID=2713571 RepID=UPI00159EAABC|nr:hypothetical protein [Arthrobacter sp. SDTb3-6]NVM99957.1 hypothetical protein [Arthrobacter sp. SDTb3-6]
MSLTLPTLVYSLPIILVMAAVVAVVVWVVVRLSRNPAGTPSRPPRPVAFPAGQGGPAGQWNAHVRRDGHLDPFSGFGTLTLAGGMLTFVPDDGTSASWSLPSAAFGVWSNSVLANSDLTVDSQATGRLLLTVSHEGINRISRNNFKTLRERRTSGEFIQAMRACGATIVG